MCFLCEAATGEFCGGLRDLDLSYNDVTHANAAHLRDMLEHCTALTSLNLDANLATGIKAINLACGLLACTALNKLSLQAIHPMHAKLLSTAGVSESCFEIPFDKTKAVNLACGLFGVHGAKYTPCMPNFKHCWRE